MVAGVLIGPSLLGWFFPSVQQWLFPAVLEVAVGSATATIPHPSMSILYALSQLGLVLYMFLVGLEFNVELIRGKVGSAGLISGAGIIVPFVFGGATALYMIGDNTFFGAGVSPWSAAVFLGASMSITAFPMLARILYERRIAQTRLGTISLAAGSIDDAIAWCLLAVVLATINRTPHVAWLAIGGGILYALAMFWAGRPLFRVFERTRQERGHVTMVSYTSLLGVVMICAWFTDVIGIYAVFGAFIAGTAMPRGAFAEEVREKTETFTTALLLPIFFVYSGLNTQLALVNTPGLWKLAGTILLIAILGKGAACTLAARAGGESWRDALTIGSLMNARGLMELIILNIGLSAGVITPTLFTIMVIMAIVTTLMASPLFHLFYRAPEPATGISGAGSAMI
jgi:Kef-type K+ transport system membrane component KefB